MKPNDLEKIKRVENEKKNSYFEKLIGVDRKERQKVEKKLPIISKYDSDLQEHDYTHFSMVRRHEYSKLDSLVGFELLPESFRYFLSDMTYGYGKTKDNSSSDGGSSSERNRESYSTSGNKLSRSIKRAYFVIAPCDPNNKRRKKPQLSSSEPRRRITILPHSHSFNTLREQKERSGISAINAPSGSHIDKKWIRLPVEQWQDRRILLNLNRNALSDAEPQGSRSSHDDVPETSSLPSTSAYIKNPTIYKFPIYKAKIFPNSDKRHLKKTIASSRKAVNDIVAHYRSYGLKKEYVNSIECPESFYSKWFWEVILLVRKSIIDAKNSMVVDQLSFDYILERYDPFLRDIVIITLTVAFQTLLFDDGVDEEVSLKAMELSGDDKRNEEYLALQASWLDHIFAEQGYWFDWVDWLVKSKLSRDTRKIIPSIQNKTESTWDISKDSLSEDWISSLEGVSIDESFIKSYKFNKRESSSEVVWKLFEVIYRYNQGYLDNPDNPDNIDSITFSHLLINDVVLNIAISPILNVIFSVTGETETGFHKKAEAVLDFITVADDAQIEWWRYLGHEIYKNGFITGYILKKNLVCCDEVPKFE